MSSKRMIAKATMALVLIGYGAAAAAECTRPRPDFQIPEGSSASEQALLAAQSALIRFGEQVGEYLDLMDSGSFERALNESGPDSVILCSHR